MQILLKRAHDARRIRRTLTVPENDSEYKNTTKGAPWRPRTISCSTPYTRQRRYMQTSRDRTQRRHLRRRFALNYYFKIETKREQHTAEVQLAVLVRCMSHLEFVPVAGRHGVGWRWGRGAGGGGSGRGAEASLRVSGERRRRARDAANTRQLTQVTVVRARERAPTQCESANARTTHARSRIRRGFSGFRFVFVLFCLWGF